MFRIAIKMLLGDRAKYLMLVSALSFAALLMTQQSSVFSGLMLWTTATLRNTVAPIWVMDPKVDQVNEGIPMRDTDLPRVRSVPGVAWAVPFFSSIEQARLFDGRFNRVALCGIDSATLIGAPAVLIQGRLQDLRQAHAVIIDEFGVEKLSVGRPKPLGIGDTFDINDHEARIVGICKAARAFYGYPYVYTTYERAIEMSPRTRKTLSFILVSPVEGRSAEQVAKQIEKDTGLRAFTEAQFAESTIRWFIRNTGIPISFGITIVLGFIVGIAVAGQTFYSFILENLGNLGALKAMGASNKLLRRMVILQAFLVGIIGYGIGLGLTSLFGFGTLKSGQPPFYMPYQIPLFTFGVILFICSISAFLGIRKISKLEAAEVFRA